MSISSNTRPRFTIAEAETLVRDLYGFDGDCQPLPSDRDQNFQVTAVSGRQYVLKIAATDTDESILDLENKAMLHIAAHSDTSLCPRVCQTRSGTEVTLIPGKRGTPYYARLLTWLPGTLLAQVYPHSFDLLYSLGQFIGGIDAILSSFHHPAANRTLKWDLKQAGFIRDYTKYIKDAEREALVIHFLAAFEAETLPQFHSLRQSIIQNDANDYNILVSHPAAGFVSDGGDGKNRREGFAVVSGIIDFGDLVLTATVCELAICGAYALFDKPDPISAAAQVIAGYHAVYPLTEQEISHLFNLICMRLCVSATMAAYQYANEPDNDYLTISAEPAWRALAKLRNCDPAFAHYAFRHACGLSPFPPQDVEANGQAYSPLTAVSSQLDKTEILALRQKHLGPSLSVSYQEPLKIVRGLGQYLYDENGRAYLDAVNNVPHVGHCHPRVVRAAQRQTAVLNTNTRYLHDHLVTYAQRLTATMPDPLNVCFFVCSGSEANELALRLARAHTGRKEILVVEGAYHGNTSTLVEISPYKFDGPGGAGAPAHVHVLPMPDGYRGPHKGHGPETGRRYAAYVQELIAKLENAGTPPGTFICEPLLGCGGQIVLPDAYLQEAYHHVRAAGGVCIADEVQIGFGRVGTHFWGFETQGVVPDIVTLGKPMGNGHPLAAVVTTPEIAASFHNGMEYFNTYGGNPVSCAIGLAVLDVIAEEKLQENALTAGNHLLAGLRRLQKRFPLIGDVRGLGLYIGVELVRDQKTLEPAAAEATYIIERMKENGVLISTDGPLHNVLKIKPPLVFSKENADFLVGMLEKVLQEDVTIPLE